MQQSTLLAAAISGILLGGSTAALAGDAPSTEKDKSAAGSKHACRS